MRFTRASRCSHPEQSSCVHSSHDLQACFNVSAVTASWHRQQRTLSCGPASQPASQEPSFGHAQLPTTSVATCSPDLPGPVRIMPATLRQRMLPCLLTGNATCPCMQPNKKNDKAWPTAGNYGLR